tara:strand:+ start:112 stop:576 length:465 start_codon:yes stop_codon:yes gene_type:complete
MVIDNPNNTIVSRKQSSGESLAYLLPNEGYREIGLLPSLLLSVLGSASRGKQDENIYDSKMDAEKKIIKYRYDVDIPSDKKNTNYTKDILTSLINNYIEIPIGKSGYINPIFLSPDISSIPNQSFDALEEFDASFIDYRPTPVDFGISYTYNLK